MRLKDTIFGYFIDFPMPNNSVIRQMLCDFMIVLDDFLQCISYVILPFIGKVQQKQYSCHNKS
jgi:hypothetical protein